MTVKEPAQFYRRLLTEVMGEKASREPQPAAALDRYFLRKGAKKSVVLIVDEVDLLATRDNSVLYRLFSWPKQQGSRLVLISIANALDLTERILPMLHRWECSPEVLNFEPYTRGQLIVSLALATCPAFPSTNLQSLPRPLVAPHALPLGMTCFRLTNHTTPPRLPRP